MKEKKIFIKLLFSILILPFLIIGSCQTENSNKKKDETKDVLIIGNEKDLFCEYFDKALSFTDKNNHKQAKYWYTKSAELGYSSAQYNLGLIFYYGGGTEQDYAQAKYWFEKAATQGHADAQSRLGNMYLVGKGVKQNYERAVYWFKEGVKQGDAYSRTALGALY